MTTGWPILALRQPLRDVRVAVASRASPEPDRIAREREQAAYERGRADGEKELSEQLLRQRQVFAGGVETATTSIETSPFLGHDGPLARSGRGERQSEDASWPRRRQPN